MSSQQLPLKHTDELCFLQKTQAAQTTDDHFIQRDGKIFAGYHLLVDLWQAHSLNNLALMRTTLKECVEICNATLLHIHLHHFEPNGGISGVAVLAESHISVHTWPERSFAAFDIFMCGKATPQNAIAILQRTFAPQNVDIRQELRGVIEQSISPIQEHGLSYEHV